MKELEDDPPHAPRHTPVRLERRAAGHNERMAQLEGEYLRRNPRRLVSAGRTREGARERGCGEAATPGTPAT
ncbi:DUF6158 family protein [Streptomyces tricolor]|nr:DUF6158 family protein [Streptomyces tricolor]